MKSVRFHRLARAELDEAVGYYERCRPGLGMDFQAEVEHVIGRIKNNPASGALYRNSLVRACILRRFPYVIYHKEIADVVWVLAVAHGKRRPSYWARRRVE